MSVTTSYDPRTLAFYEEHAQEFCESTAFLDLRKLHERFLKVLPPGGRILDAGCGSGRDTRAFVARGYGVTAMDASPQMARLAAAFTGQECQVLSFQEMEFSEEFGGIWVCASLLHIPKHEIANVMTRFIKALKKNGILYISLKEGEGERIAEDGRFFNYYTVDSFRIVLANFPALREIDYWETDSIRGGRDSAPWLNFLLKKVTPAP